MRFSKTFTIDACQVQVLKDKMLNWLRQFGIFAYLDNNQYQNKPNRFECIVAAGAQQKIQSIADLKLNFGKDWLFGHLNYDAKNWLYPDLKSEHPPMFENDTLFFFKPAHLIRMPYASNTLIIESDSLDPDYIFQSINEEEAIAISTNKSLPNFKKSFNQTEYLQAVEQVKEHIRQGNCYELNLCVGASAESVNIDAFESFKKLNQSNPAPFAAFYKVETKYALCSSPERFLYKDGNVVIAQPMKGTIRRASNKEEDEQLKIQLQNDIKERAENVMIVDLMRNDLAKTCKVASVQVPELFGVYTFPSLHTMISTIKAEIKTSKSALDVVLEAFPMGSMTGAPKKIVMEIIESIERNKRELYAGMMGYCSPEADFDFNVVIRTILYNEKTQQLSYQTGGAITIDSIPEKEWEEVLLKAKSLEAIFEK